MVATRFVWNLALDRRSTAYRADGTKLNWVALSREFTVLRAALDTAWLQPVTDGRAAGLTIAMHG